MPVQREQWSPGSKETAVRVSERESSIHSPEPGNIRKNNQTFTSKHTSNSSELGSDLTPDYPGSSPRLAISPLLVGLTCGESISWR